MANYKGHIAGGAVGHEKRPQLTSVSRGAAAVTHKASGSELPVDILEGALSGLLTFDYRVDS